MGAIIAYDLLSDRIVWAREYPGIDSLAISRDGRRIYSPSGRDSAGGRWDMLDASNGDVMGGIDAGARPHNTVVSLDGRRVYLAGRGYPYLVVASTANNRIIRRIGPLLSGGRPFTINGRETIAYTTANDLLGFQVSSIKSGNVLYTIRVPGFSYDIKSYGADSSPSHGISLSPDERQLYVIDSANGYVHVFDVSRVPRSRPRHIADIELGSAASDGWLQHSRNGRYVYVGRSGDVIDTRSLKVAKLPLLRETADTLEVDWRHGRPVATTSRYGLGYVRR